MDKQSNDIFDLFNKAKETIIYPNLIFPCEINASGKIKITMATNRSKHPGTINVTDGKKYGNNKYYDRVEKRHDGLISIQWYPSSNEDGVVEEIKKLVNNPVEEAQIRGIKFKNCCFCGIRLTNEASLEAGYGPICADNYGLPWGPWKEDGKNGKEDSKEKEEPDLSKEDLF